MKPHPSLSPRYSGSLSKGFWRQVNALEDDADRSAIYALGCILQNIETYVLTQLRNAEVTQASKSTKP